MKKKFLGNFALTYQYRMTNISAFKCVGGGGGGAND